jgi:ABC-type lipoprotein export system ATPase subunit
MKISETDNIFSHLKDMVGSGTAVVFVSHNSEMNGFANRQLTVAGGEIRTTFD